MDETDRALLIAKWMMVVGFSLVAVSQLGHYLHWWNDLGDFGTLLGLFLGFVGVLVTLLLSASRKQLVRVAVAVGEGNQMHRQGLEMNHQTNTKLDTVVELLRQIRDRL